MDQHIGLAVENTSPEFLDAIARFPLGDILTTAHGIHELQTVIPEYFGLVVTDKKVNMGTHVCSTIPLADADDIAQTALIEEMGAELTEEHRNEAKDYQMQLPRLLSRPKATEIRLNIKKTILKEAQILGYVVLPKSTATTAAGLLTEPQITILHEDTEKQLALDEPVVLSDEPGASEGIILKVQIRLPSGTYKGFIGKWVVLAVKGKWSNVGKSLLQVTESTFLTAFKISACIVDESSSLIPANLNKANLSIDARIFVPTVSLNYFDAPMVTFGEYEINTMDGCTMFQMPLNMRNVLLSVHSKKTPMPPSIQQIIDLARKEPTVSHERVFQNGFLTWIEEHKMMSDIKYFDASNITLTVTENKAELDFFLFKQQFPAPADRNKPNAEAKVYTLLLTFTVLGSNESRPKIQVGDRVRVRPTMHSLMEQSRKLRHESPIACPFELQAIVQSFDLRTEKVVCELPMLAKTCIGFLEFLAQMGVQSNAVNNKDENGVPRPGPRGQSQHFIKFLESLTYQVRFHYDTTGLAFCHEALQSYLPPPSPPAAPGNDNNSATSTTSSISSSSSSLPSSSSSSAISSFSPSQHLTLREEIVVKPLDILFPEPGLKERLLDDTGRGEMITQIARGVRQEMLSGKSLSGMGANGEYNDEQLECISSIVALHATPQISDLPPYCVYGPPGTGKTKCVVGSLIELLERYPKVRILACAPSDAAADVLAVRLSRYLVRRQEILVQQGLAPRGDPSIVNMIPVMSVPGGGKIPLLSSGVGKPGGAVPGFVPGIVPGVAGPAVSAAFEHKLLRLNWYNRVYDSVPLELLSFCHLPKGGKLFEIPNYDVLKLFRIIVTTCGVAGALRHNTATLYDPFTPGQFTTAVVPLEFDYVFVDEASQCTEAEALIPMSLVKKHHGNANPQQRGGVVVLAGDPKQLGPNTRSQIYREVRAKTLLERLLENDVYAGITPAAAAAAAAASSSASSSPSSALTTVFNSSSSRPFNMGVMLVNNYRSHRKLLEVPSRLFYVSALREAVLDRSKVDRFIAFTTYLRHVDFAASLRNPSEGLVTSTIYADPPNASFSGIFVAVEGKHEHPLDSPSFFNVAEIDAIVLLCKKLTSSPEMTGGRLLVTDIGIIGAFRAQVLRIRLALRKENLGGISVGSVEDFQGQEKQVIIITTVLCSKPPVLNEFSLGLINDARRFNVAVTRGMGLCIVVGNQHFLHKDPNWREWIEFCDLNANLLNQGSSRLFQRHRKEEIEADELLGMAASNSFQFLDDLEDDGGGGGLSRGHGGVGSPTDDALQKELDSFGGMPTDQMWRSVL